MKRIFRLVFCTNEVYSLLHLFGETISRGPEKGEIKLILLNNQKQKYYNTFCTTSINVLYRFRHVQIKVPVGPVSFRSVPGVQCLAQEPIMVMFFYDMDHHGDMQIQNNSETCLNWTSLGQALVFQIDRSLLYAGSIYTDFLYRDFIDCFIQGSALKGFIVYK